MSSTVNLQTRRVNASEIDKAKEMQKLRDRLCIGVEVMTTDQLCRSLLKRDVLNLSEAKIREIELQLRKANVKQQFDRLPSLSWEMLKPDLLNIVEHALELDADGFSTTSGHSSSVKRQIRSRKHIRPMKPVDQMSVEQLFRAFRQQGTLGLSQNTIKKIRLRLRKAYVAAEFNQLPDLSWRQQKSVLMDMLEAG